MNILCFCFHLKKNGGLESGISMQYKVLPADIYLVFVNLFLKPSTSNLLVIQKKPSRTSKARKGFIKSYIRLFGISETLLNLREFISYLNSRELWHWTSNYVLPHQIQKEKWICIEHFRFGYWYYLMSSMQIVANEIRGTRREIPPSIASSFIAKVWI